MAIFQVSKILICLEVIGLLRSRHVVDGIEHVNAKTKAIRDYLTLCTDINTCGRNVTHLPTPVPCCKVCSCDDQCGYNCCPDGPQHYMTPEDIAVLKANDIKKCIKPSLKTDMFSELWPWFTMIAGCPNAFDDVEIKEKCLQPYGQFSLDNQTWNIPVTVNSTTYRNVYCAMCNGVDVDHSLVWEVVLQCYKLFGLSRNYLSTMNIANAQDIQSVVLANEPTLGPCNVLYNIPFVPGTESRVDGVEECFGVIDRCNVTGLWAAPPYPNDYHIESACLSYESLYDQYRNIHCYLCNGGNFSAVVDRLCSTSYFDFEKTALTLVVRNSIVRDNQTCGPDYVLDEHSNACRRLHCSRGFVLDGTQCLPFIQHHSLVFLYFVYDVTLTLEPDYSSLTEKITPRWTDDLFTQMDRDIRMKLHLTGGSVYSICDRRSFVKFKQSVHGLVNKLKTESRDILLFDVMYFALSFRISVTNVKNLTQIMRGLDQLYNFTRVDINGRLLNNRPRRIESQLVEKAVEKHDSVFANITNSLIRVGLIKSLGLISYAEDMLIFSMTDESDGRGFTHLGNNYIGHQNSDKNVCKTIAEINKDVFCPKIELTSGEYTIEGDGVRVRSVNRYMPADDVQFGSGLNTIRMCQDKYTELVRDGPVSEGRRIAALLTPMVFALSTNPVHGI